MNETRAIALCIKHHDPAGFEYLFKQFRREAYFHAISFLNNHEEATDACQECFSKAYTAMPKLKELKNFYPWFYSILRNHCMNILKKQSTAQRYVLHEAGNDTKQANTISPDILMAQKEDHRETWQTLGKLDPHVREILVLKYIEDRSYAEISELLNIPRGTVMSRLYHARKAFQSTYTKSKTIKGGEHEIL